MKRLLVAALLLLGLASRGVATTGAITAVSVNTTGFDIYVTFTGFSPFGTFNTGLPNTTGNNNPTNALIVLTVTPPAYTPVAGMNTGVRTVHGTWPVRYAYPANWAASTAYALNNTVSDGTYLQKVIACSGTCTSKSGTHPTWATTLGGTTIDNAGSNQITWENMAALPTYGGNNTDFDENTSVAGSLTVRIALDEEIYATDTAVVANIGAGLYVDNGPGNTSGGASSLAATNLTVTNNSTLNYPKPVFRWTSVPYQRVTGPFVLEMTGGAHFAQNQGEVAAVTYTCGDQHSNSNSVTVSKMTVSTLFQDVYAVIVYAGTMPITGFTEGDQLTCNALVYPWFGDSNAVLNTAVGADGHAQPAETLGPQYEVNDPTGAYGYGYAAVTTSGSDSTCTGHVFNTRAAAEADTGFASVTKAAACIEAYNAANYSRSDAGGGTILMGAKNGWGYCTTSGSALGTMETWLTIDKFSSLAQSQVVFTSGPGGSNRYCDSDKNTLLKFQNLTFNGGSNTLLITGNTTGTDSFWIHNVNFSSSSVDPFYWSPGALWTTQSTFPTFSQGFDHYTDGVRTAWALVRGANCASPEPAEVYAIVGSSNVVPTRWVGTPDTTLATSDGSVYAFNSALNMPSTTTVDPDTTATAATPHGTAWVQSVWENITTQGVFWCGAAAPAVNCDNWVIQHITLPCGTPAPGSAAACSEGAPGTNNRIGMGYTDGETTGGLTRYNWSFKFNNVVWLNSKTDDYTPGTPGPLAVANWSMVYGTGFMGNCEQTTEQLSTEFWGLGWVEPCATNYLNDASGGYGNPGGNTTGNGNYHIQAPSGAINVAPWTTVSSDVLPYDLEGHPRVGRIVAGAYTFGTARRGWR